MLYFENHKKIFSTVAASFFLFLFHPLFSFSQATEADAIFILKGSTKLLSGKAAEGVELELKKNGQTITKNLSGKNGKYYMKLNVSILNKDNEYLLYISRPGTIPKTLSINTYIPPEEFRTYTSPIYEFLLPIIMIETTEKDIVLERPSGKIIWDNTQHSFAFDQTYARVIQKEEDNPDKFLAEKKKKEEEELAKKKADEEARLKADAEAKALADKKSKEDADKILQKNLEAMKLDIIQKRMQDSLDSLAAAAATAGKATVEIKKFSKPVSPDDVDQNAFDGTGAFSINIAKKSLKAAKEKMNREKAANLSAKYETNNTLTSLLNMVDEDDKNNKQKAKSKKP